MTRATRADLTGRWMLTRRIDDRRGGGDGAFLGVADFEPDGAGLIQREQGSLWIEARELFATRAYRWGFPGADRVELFFEDGAFFHDFDPRGETAEAEHLCGEDLYRVTYSFGTDPDWWIAEWDVVGPRKDYRMVTAYARERKDEPEMIHQLWGGG